MWKQIRDSGGRQHYIICFPYVCDRRHNNIIVTHEVGPVFWKHQGGYTLV